MLQPRSGIQHRLDARKWAVLFAGQVSARQRMPHQLLLTILRVACHSRCSCTSHVLRREGAECVGQARRTSQDFWSSAFWSPPLPSPPLPPFLPPAPLASVALPSVVALAVPLAVALPAAAGGGGGLGCKAAHAGSDSQAHPASHMLTPHQFELMNTVVTGRGVCNVVWF